VKLHPWIAVRCLQSTVQLSLGSDEDEDDDDDDDTNEDSGSEAC